MILETANYVLAPLDANDSDDLFALFSDRNVTEYLDFAPMTERREALDILAWARNLRQAAVGIRWSIRARDSGEFLGTCGYHQLVRDRAKRGEIGFDLHRKWWGRGVMNEVLPEAVRAGFEEFGLHRIQALVTPANERSCRLLERHRFRSEGLLRSYAQWCDEFHDLVMYARLRDDA